MNLFGKFYLSQINYLFLKKVHQNVLFSKISYLFYANFDIQKLVYKCEIFPEIS